MSGRFDRQPGGSPALSQRELEVLICGAHGMTVHETADWLGLASNTVSNHRKLAIKRLGLPGWKSVTVDAYRMLGWLTPPPLPQKGPSSGRSSSSAPSGMSAPTCRSRTMNAGVLTKPSRVGRMSR